MNTGRDQHTEETGDKRGRLVESKVQGLEEENDLAGAGKLLELMTRQVSAEPKGCRHTRSQQGLQRYT